MTNSDQLRRNLGTRRVPALRMADFPDAGAAVQTLTSSTRPAGSVDIMLVNPPSPDGGIWIRSQHRVGRRSRENMIWPQVSLAQLASLLVPDYTVEIVDAIATRMTWDEFERILEKKRPKYYLTQVTAPTLRNDMFGVFLAKSLGAQTMAFGTHVTPMTLETMRPFPALDYVLRGEPEATLRELLDLLEDKEPSDPRVAKIVEDTKLGRGTTVRGQKSEVGGQRSEQKAMRCSRAEGRRKATATPLELAINPSPLAYPQNRRAKVTINHSIDLLLSPFAAATAERVPQAVLDEAEQLPLAEIPGSGLAARRRDHHQPRPTLLPQPGRPADAAASPAAAGQAAHADDQGAVYVYRHQPRLPGRLQILHQARLLPEQRPPALARADLRRTASC